MRRLVQPVFEQLHLKEAVLENPELVIRLCMLEARTTVSWPFAATLCAAGWVKTVLTILRREIDRGNTELIFPLCEAVYRLLRDRGEVGRARFVGEEELAVLDQVRLNTRLIGRRFSAPRYAAEALFLLRAVH